MIRFFIKFVIWTAIMAVPPLFITKLYEGWLAQKFWAMFAFFALVTIITCVTVLMGQSRNSKLGVQVFMVASIVKLLACMTFALLYLRNYAANGVIFIASFFYLYFFFTVFEIYTLLTNLRVQNKK